MNLENANPSAVRVTEQKQVPKQQSPYLTALTPATRITGAGAQNAARNTPDISETGTVGR